ncbi:MAG TPA: GGDEF domain-containing protein [Bacillota bacterium]|nr:GGDEF domain-containing protein [Bacillota bacterium]
MIAFYIMYRLNRDYKTPSISSVFIGGLISVLFSSLQSILMPEMDSLIIKVMLNLLLFFLLQVVFFKYTVFQSFLTAIFGMIILGLGDIFVAMVYVYPLRLSIGDYRGSLTHVTAGSAIIFLFIYITLYFFADRFIKIRKRIYRRHKKFAVLLSANLTAALMIFLITYNFFRYIWSFKGISNFNRVDFYSGTAIGIGSVIVITLVTLYLINYLLLNKLKYDRMQKSYVMDDLTEVLNRTSGMDFLREQLETCKAANDPLAVCYIDIDDLKVVNDTFGHKAGDQLITTVIDTVKMNIRETDAIARLGGDEFVIIFPGCNMEFGKRVLLRVEEELKGIKLSGGFKISFSYGFSEYGGKTKVSAEELLEIADKEMYLNKQVIKAMY